MSGSDIANPALESHTASRARKDSLFFFFLGSVIFLLMGTALEMAAPVTTVDFRVVYYSARCLLHHRDPYNAADLSNTYHEEGGESVRDSPQIRRSERMYNYLPTAFPITLPFALFPFEIAHRLWLAFTVLSLGLASYLVWDVAARSAPLLAGILVGLSLASSELFLILGNPAGIAVALCVIAVWCLDQQKFVFAGLICFALSLMLKPHDGGLIWLYLLVSGPMNRRRALQILGLVILFSLPILLWLGHLAPGWFHELQATFATYSSHGDVNDPGPSSMASHGIGMVINLQAPLSLFRDDPHFYNPLTYLICGPLLIYWLILVVRSSQRDMIDWFALGPVAALSMLPVYHRIYDARLLLVAIPVCACLQVRRGMMRWVIVAACTIAIAITGGMPWAIFLLLLKQGHLQAFASSPHLLVALQVVPVPLMLLVVGSLLMWAFVRHESEMSHRSLTLEQQKTT